VRKNSHDDNNGQNDKTNKDGNHEGTSSDSILSEEMKPNPKNSKKVKNVKIEKIAETNNIEEDNFDILDKEEPNCEAMIKLIEYMAIKEPSSQLLTQLVMNTEVLNYLFLNL
jgi:hypothetical protein